MRRRSEQRRKRKGGSRRSIGKGTEELEGKLEGGGKVEDELEEKEKKEDGRKKNISVKDTSSVGKISRIQPCKWDGRTTNPAIAHFKGLVDFIPYYERCLIANM